MNNEKFHIFSENDKKCLDLLEKYITNNYSNQRKPKYSNLYYLYYIYYVLKTGTQWKLLLCECHYTSIYKKFTEWNRLNIFKNYYNSMLNDYLIKNIIKNTLIDSSHIKNINGSDSIGKNHYDRYRNSTKLHLIIDENRIPLNYCFSGSNIHDSKMTINLSEKLKLIAKKDRRRTINLVGNKGYISENTRLELKMSNIYLYTPIKNYNKKDNTKDNKSKKDQKKYTK